VPASAFALPDFKTSGSPTKVSAASRVSTGVCCLVVLGTGEPLTRAVFPATAPLVAGERTTLAEHFEQRAGLTTSPAGIANTALQSGQIRVAMCYQNYSTAMIRRRFIFPISFKMKELKQKRM